MPPRLTSLSAPARFVRSFTTTAPICAPRESSHSSPANTTSRLSNINNPPPRVHDRPPRSDSATRLLDRYRTRTQRYVNEKTAQVDYIKNQKITNDYLRQMPRRWQAGDVYSPHDLSPVEMQKWRKRSLRNNDVVDALGINPLDMYKNFSLIEHFTTASGMINHSQVTRLRPVNQRKIAKMVRRVQGMGIYPSVHAHPEMIRDQFFPRNRNNVFGKQSR